jgi:hypothetical protein
VLNVEYFENTIYMLLCTGFLFDLLSDFSLHVVFLFPLLAQGFLFPLLRRHFLPSVCFLTFTFRHNFLFTPPPQLFFPPSGWKEERKQISKMLCSEFSSSFSLQILLFDAPVSFSLSIAFLFSHVCTQRNILWPIPLSLMLSRTHPYIQGREGKSNSVL